MKFSDNFIFKLKSSCDICSIFSSYVELKSCGSNLRCCCPFHFEKTPSCFVYRGTQSFYCFGCGVGGDVITFIEKIENLSYCESISFLAEKIGIKIPVNDFFESSSDFKSIGRKRLLQVNRAAAMFFYKNLFSDKGISGLSYLKARGLEKKSIIRFGLGYSSNGWTCLLDYLKSRGFSDNELIESGLVLKSKSGRLYDKFRNRIIFPIVGLKGEVFGFGGRILDGRGPKYLNSADSIVFKKGSLLYGLNIVNKDYINSNGGDSHCKRDSLILCEGYMDVISLHQYGFSNAVAALGTALTEQQVFLISRNASEVFIAYDSDKSGEAAMVRACAMFEQINFKARVLRLKGAKDPDEFLKNKGSTRFRVLLEESASFERSFFEEIKFEFGLLSAEERRLRVHKLCEVISGMSDVLRREVYINKICAELGLTKSVVVGHVNHLIRKNRLRNESYKRNKLHRTNVFGEGFVAGNDENFRLVRAQEGLIRLVFENPVLAEKIDVKFNFSWFSSSFLRKSFKFLIGRINSGFSVDFSSFRCAVSEAEFGYLARILNATENKNHSSGVVEEFDSYIRFLRSEFMKKGENVLKMSLSELELKRQKNAKLKF